MFGSTFLLPIYLQNSLDYTPLQAGLVFLPVGLLQALAAPFAGGFSDRSSPKVPVILGLLLMAFSFYQFGFLSSLTEKHSIMLPLCVRGVAMGMLFAPLMTTAISEIPNRKMAQASGLLNVIRQLGGSFGVAVFGSVLTRRMIHHATRYGEQINPNSDAFRSTVLRLQGFALQTTGGTRAAALARAQAQIASFVANEAFIRAVSDVFLMAGATVLLGVVPVLLLRTHKVRMGSRRRGPAPAERGGG
jgi:DHA2 family multidrug resistance protein